MNGIDLTEAIEAARRNLARREGNEYMHRGCGKGCMHYLSAEAALHVAGPLIEAAVREQVAREIDADLDVISEGGHTVIFDADGEPDECVDDCPACAVERIRSNLIARGES